MSGDYINTKYMDKSAWDRIYSTSLEIYEFDKSRIISESQKFKLNAQTTFISLRDILSGEGNVFSIQFPLYQKAFVNTVLSNEKILSSSLNPKIMAFAFYALYIVTDNMDGFHIFFDKKRAQEFLKIIHNYLETEEYKHKDTKLYEFLKKTGCTPSNLVRYFIYYEQMFPKPPVTMGNYNE